MTSMRNGNSYRVDPSGVIHNEEAVVVGVAAEMRLLSVNDAEEIFKVALLIHCHFKLPEEELTDEVRAMYGPDENAVDGFERMNDYNLFTPTMVMVNCVDTQFEHFDETVRVNVKTGDIWVSYYNTCSISESLELESFPFDRQLFRVSFKSPDAKLVAWTLATDCLDFPKLYSKKKVVHEKDAIYLVACELKNWFMHDFFVENFPNDDDPVSLTQGEFTITIQAERDPKFYFFNFYFVLYFIVLTNVTNVSVSPAEAGDRHALTITLLLTAVAFKFVLIEGTPKVGYLTYMDKYVIMSYIFIMIAVLENIFVSPQVICNFNDEFECFIDDEDLAADLKDGDNVFFAIYTGVWTFINLFVTVVCFFPSLLRLSWSDVIDGQIGQTEQTLKRTKKVENGNENQNVKLRKMGIEPSTRRGPPGPAQDVDNENVL